MLKLRHRIIVYSKIILAPSVSYKQNDVDVTYNQTLFDLYTDHYLIELYITDYDNGLNKNLYTIAEYLLNSIQVLK